MPSSEPPARGKRVRERTCTGASHLFAAARTAAGPATGQGALTRHPACPQIMLLRWAQAGTDHPDAEQRRRAECGAGQRGHLVPGRELPTRPLAAGLRDLGCGRATGASAGGVARDAAGVGRGVVPVHRHRAPRGHRAPQQAPHPTGQPEHFDRRGRTARCGCGLRDHRAVPPLSVRGQPGQRPRQPRPARDLPGHLAGQRAADRGRGNLAASGCAARTGHQHRHGRLLPRRSRHGGLRRRRLLWRRPGLRADRLAAVHRRRCAGCLAARAR